jgi:hypothetical protein
MSSIDDLPPKRILASYSFIKLETECEFHNKRDLPEIGKLIEIELQVNLFSKRVLYTFDVNRENRYVDGETFQEI